MRLFLQKILTDLLAKNRPGALPWAATRWLRRAFNNFVSRPHRSVVGAVDLALGVQEPLPVVGLVGLLGVGVDRDLEVPAEEALADVEDIDSLRAAHECPDDGADQRGRRAPFADRQAGEDIELVAVLELLDAAALDLP